MATVVEARPSGSTQLDVELFDIMKRVMMLNGVVVAVIFG